MNKEQSKENVSINAYTLTEAGTKTRSFDDELETVAHVNIVRRFQRAYAATQQLHELQ